MGYQANLSKARTKQAQARSVAPAAQQRPTSSTPSWINNLANQISSSIQKAATSVGNWGKNIPKASGPALKWASSATTPQKRQADVVNAAQQAGQWISNAAKGLLSGQPQQGTDWVKASRQGYSISDYVPPANYRYENPEMQMTPDEYLMRRNAQTKMFFPAQWADYMSKAQATPNISHDNTSQWAARNVAPGSNFWQNQQEYILRNNVAPPGTVYMPFGATYYPKASLPDVQASPAPAATSGYGGYGGGYTPRSYGGGGGYSGGGYSDALKEYYNSMVNWAINQAARGG